jgi:hypothetical protein
MNTRPQVTAIPMIHMRLPPKWDPNDGPIELKTALDQNQIFLERGIIVQKTTSVIWSRGVLIFYVDRRASSINISQSLNGTSTLSFLTSPSAIPIVGFEKLNTTRVSFDKNSLELANVQYELRSVVFSEVTTIGNSTSVIGSSTLIRYPEVPGKSNEQFLVYNPFLPSNNKGFNQPFATIDEHSNGVDPVNFTDSASEKGTIFVYASVNDQVNDSASIPF